MLTLLIALLSPAWACEPCPTDFELDVTQAAKEATLIALVKRAPAAAQPAPSPGHPVEEPDVLVVDLVKTLKGKAKERLTVNSWDGMCDYGVVIKPDDTKTYLVLLSWSEQHKHFQQVHQGCAPYQLPVVNGSVTLPEGKGRIGRLGEARGKKTKVDALPKALGLE